MSTNADYKRFLETLRELNIEEPILGESKFYLQCCSVKKIIIIACIHHFIAKKEWYCTLC